MSKEFEPRRRGIGGVLYAAVVLSLTAYMSFAALQGEHGLFTLFQVQAQEHQLLAELDRVEADLSEISNRAQRLSTEHLDVELLDEQARKVLGLARSDEVIAR